MRGYYRVMAGRSSMHAELCRVEGFIGVDFDIHQDLTGSLPDEVRESATIDWNLKEGVRAAMKTRIQEGRSLMLPPPLKRRELNEGCVGWFGWPFRDEDENRHRDPNSPRTR